MGGSLGRVLGDDSNKTKGVNGTVASIVGDPEIVR